MGPPNSPGLMGPPDFSASAPRPPGSWKNPGGPWGLGGVGGAQWAPWASMFFFLSIKRINVFYVILKAYL